MTEAAFDVAVIGAGVVGLAIARRLAEAGMATVLIERELRHGLGASSRNSACIHAGVYYHQGSLKGRLCLRGRDQLYDHCNRYAVPCRRTGKLFVATNDDAVKGLGRLMALGEVNGVSGLELWDGDRVKHAEPALSVPAAVYCPDSGLLDVEAFMLSLLALGEEAGVTFAKGTAIRDASFSRSGWRLIFGDHAQDTVTVKRVVNASGLWGLDLARKVFPGRAIPEAKPSRGRYYRLARGRSPLSTIVYPDLVPGVLMPRCDATPGLDGVLRFGPDTAPATSYDDYRPADGIAAELVNNIRRYLPSMRADDLVPDYAGVRPRIAAPDGTVPDFTFDRAPLPGWLDLWGIESPALTASLAIADYALELIQQ